MAKKLTKNTKATENTNTTTTKGVNNTSKATSSKKETPKTTPKAEPKKEEAKKAPVEMPPFNKATKDQLVEFIGANAPEVFKDKSLKDLQESITYTDKMLRTDTKKVTKADLISLSKKVFEALKGIVVLEVNNTPIFSVPAASLKVNNKKTTAKEEPKKEEETKKTGSKKLKKPPVIEQPNFPDTLMVGDEEYKLSDVKDIKELAKKAEGDTEFLFAFWWTKTLLKQFAYAGGTLEAPKEFPDNLDLVTLMYVSDSGVVSYGLSMYTEALYQVMPDAYEVCENGIRYSDGIEFQIYEKE